MPRSDDMSFDHEAPMQYSQPRRTDRSRERYPTDGSLKEVFVEERHRRRNSAMPKTKLPFEQDQIVRRTYRPSRSVEPRRRQVEFNDRDYHISDDSDSEHKRSRALNRQKSDHKLVPHRGDRDHYSHRSAPKSKSRDYDSGSDSGYSSDEEEQKAVKQRNRSLLYTGLACVTSVAAANNIYQNTKNHHARRAKIRDGNTKLSLEEAEKIKRKALMMDVFTLGVAAVGLNNAHNSWKKAESVRQGN